MDSQSYLNEISASVRPQKKSKFSFLKSKFFLVGTICVVGLILMAVIGAILGGGRNGVKEQAYSLQYRLSNTSKTISDYQKYVKSSDLRSSSASLNSIISNTNRDLSNYLEETYKKSEKENEKLKNKEDEHNSELNTELFEARINGILDRIYAHKMDYEISLILSMEKKLYDATNNESLKTLLNTSYDSLVNLQEKFESFSEGK